MNQTLKRGDIVRSTINPSYAWRIVAIGPKRATLVKTEGGYMRCYCAPSVLRKLPPEPTLMDKTRAAVAYLNGPRRDSETEKMFAFLSLFHPDIPPERRLALSRRDHQ